MSDLLSREDHKILATAGFDSYEVANVLNRNGKANWTVCPECRVDDFTHVKGCSIHEEITSNET